MKNINKSKKAYDEAFEELHELRNNAYELEENYYQIIDAKRGTLKVEDAHKLHFAVNTWLTPKN